MLKVKTLWWNRHVLEVKIWRHVTCAIKERDILSQAARNPFTTLVSFTIGHWAIFRANSHLTSPPPHLTSPLSGLWTNAEWPRKYRWLKAVVQTWFAQHFNNIVHNWNWTQVLGNCKIIFLLFFHSLSLNVLCHKPFSLSFWRWNLFALKLWINIKISFFLSILNYLYFKTIRIEDIEAVSLVCSWTISTC